MAVYLLRNAVKDAVAAAGLAAATARKRKKSKMAIQTMRLFVNQPTPHAALIAAFRRAQADAAHKSGLIQSVANKGPKAIQAAVETAAKAVKRRDSYAKKLSALGVLPKD